MIPGDALQPIVDELKALRAAVDKQPRMVWATVTSTDPLRVRVDGDTVAMDASPALATLTPRAGSRVYCVMQNGRATVVGVPDIVTTSGEIKIGSVLLTDSFQDFGYTDGYVFARQPNVTLQLLASASASIGMLAMVSERSASGFRARKTGGSGDSATFMYIAATETD